MAELGLVVLCGTAVTIERVAADGTWQGGAIAAGLSMTARALHLLTAQLPLVDPREAPPAVPEAAADERADVERELSRARSALLARDERTALAVASKLEESEGPYRQAAGLRIRAGVELARGDNTAAGLHAGRSFTLWQSPDAAVVDLTHAPVTEYAEGVPMIDLAQLKSRRSQP